MVRILVLGTSDRGSIPLTWIIAIQSAGAVIHALADQQVQGRKNK